MKNFKGVIIEESLAEASVLLAVQIASTRTVPVTERHRTPWLQKWTMHTCEVPPHEMDRVAELLGQSLKAGWYADFNDGEAFYAIFSNKVFKYFSGEVDGRNNAVEYGLAAGIPEHQMNGLPKA